MSTFKRGGRQAMKIVTIERGREVAAAQAERIRVEASYSIRAGNMVEEMERERSKPVHAPDRTSVKRAMDVVERQLVEALWTLARLPDRNPFGNGRCGIEYVQERGDYRAEDATGGKWDPSRPSPRAIDAMHEPLEWLTWLKPDHAKLVSVAAATKRGSSDRNISWARVRAAYPPAHSLSIPTLHRRYADGIRAIVSELTIRHMQKRA
jgi:hypothetical protein